MGIRSVCWALSGALAIGLAGGGVVLAPAAAAEKIDLDTPEGAVAAMRKLNCSLNDGEDVTYWWNGHMYSRVPGEADRQLFYVEGMNIRQCMTVEDETRGTGYRMVSREILLYMDPQTREVVDQWENPWTGETLEVLHVDNDPVNMRAPSFPYDAQGNPAARFNGVVEGDLFWLTTIVPLFYQNPLGGDYQQYVGNIHHATEMFNFMGRVDELTDPNTPTIHNHVGWVRVSDWLPWMKMRGRAGTVYFHTAGRKLASFDDLSDTLLEQIETRFQKYAEPPPLDDARPNETSWTYFKKRIDAARAQQ
jgi:hypothetical protein